MGFVLRFVLIFVLRIVFNCIVICIWICIGIFLFTGIGICLFVLGLLFDIWTHIFVWYWIEIGIQYGILIYNLYLYDLALTTAIIIIIIIIIIPNIFCLLLLLIMMTVLLLMILCFRNIAIVISIVVIFFCCFGRFFIFKLYKPSLRTKLLVAGGSWERQKQLW